MAGRYPKDIRKPFPYGGKEGFATKSFEQTKKDRFTSDAEWKKSKGKLPESMEPFK